MKNRIYTTFLFLLLANSLFSQLPFTPGNVVVVRVGDGSAALNNTAHAVFLEEYTSTGGSPVQTIAMPTSISGTNKRFSIQGNNATVGYLALSQNGQYLALTGYDAAPGTSSAAMSAATTQRVIGVVDYRGVINTSTAITDAGTGIPFSAVTSNGSDLWAVFGTTGLRYASLGSNTSSQILSANTSRTLGNYGGNLYTGISTGSILKVGSGLPTSGLQITSPLTSNTQGGVSPNGFFIADLNPGVAGYDVIYLAGQGGALQKYSFNGSSWTLKGKIGATADVYFSVTGSITDTIVTLYATRKVSASVSELVSLVDNTGYDGSIAGMVPTLLTTSPANTGFRGVAIAPVKCKQPLLRLGATTPTSMEVYVTDSLSVGGPYEYEISTNATPSGSGTSVSSNIINDFNLSPGVHYYVHIRRNCGGGNFSLWATLDFTTSWPPCTAPTNLIQGLNGNNATVSWSTVFTAIKYEYAVTTDPSPIASALFVTGPTVSLNGLLSTNPYYFHVRAYCGGGDTSAWATKLITTPCFTPKPYLITNNWQAGTAEVGWSGEPSSKIFEYTILSSEAPALGSIRFVYDTIISIRDLVPGSKYHLSVRQRCSGGTVSNWGKLEFNVSGAHVYPSPANDQITIRVYGQETNGKMVFIYDANGRQMIGLKLVGNTATTNIERWSRGVYFVRFGNENKYITRIIKQ